MKKTDMVALMCYFLLFMGTWWAIRSGILAIFNTDHPYYAGFCQFFIFATGGEFISTRLTTKSWQMNKIFIYKALIWGLGGMLIALNFHLFYVGIADAMNIGMLPFKGNNLAHAFYTSSANNLMYGPIHSAFTVIAGVYLELRVIQKRHISLSYAINSVNWGQFVNFIMFKCIPFFWIPVNTLTFLLPNEYRVACAAVLSLVYGILITILKLSQKKYMHNIFEEGGEKPENTYKCYTREVQIKKLFSE